MLSIIYILTGELQQDFQLIQNTTLSIQFDSHPEQPTEITKLRQHAHVAILIYQQAMSRKKLDSQEKLEAQDSKKKMRQAFAGPPMD